MSRHDSGQIGQSNQSNIQALNEDGQGPSNIMSDHGSNHTTLSNAVGPIQKNGTIVGVTSELPADQFGGN